MTQELPRPPVGRFGRLARSGTVGVPPRGGSAVKDAAAALQIVATRLREQLDRIRDDEILTPRERRAEVASVISTARSEFDRVCVKIHNAQANAGGQVENLQSLLAQYEAKQTPVSLRRLELQAEAIRRMEPLAQGSALEQAEKAKDFQSLLAHSLVSADSTAATHAFLRAARPAEYQQAREDVAASGNLVASAARFAAGLAELATDPDAHAASGGNAADVLALGAATEDSVPPLGPVASGVWPLWARP